MLFWVEHQRPAVSVVWHFIGHVSSLSDVVFNFHVDHFGSEARRTQLWQLIPNHYSARVFIIPGNLRKKSSEFCETILSATQDAPLLTEREIVHSLLAVSWRSGNWETGPRTWWDWNCHHWSLTWLGCSREPYPCTGNDSFTFLFHFHNDSFNFLFHIPVDR